MNVPREQMFMSRRTKDYSFSSVLIGTYGDPAGFLKRINDHEGTGHTYQRKEQQAADSILELMKGWD